MSKFSENYKRIFGEEYVKEPYKFVSHSFTKTIVGKKYCSRCGLMALNNPFTEWAIDKGCNNSDHPNYQQQRRKAHK